jgi:hypothetical protein
MGRAGDGDLVHVLGEHYHLLDVLAVDFEDSEANARVAQCSESRGSRYGLRAGDSV